MLQPERILYLYLLARSIFRLSFNDGQRYIT
jgi:hypothetical protein